VSTPRPYVPKEIRAALDATGLPWEVIHGKKHNRLLLNGAQVGVLARSKQKCSENYQMKNTIAAIRRAAAAGSTGPSCR